MVATVELCSGLQLGVHVTDEYIARIDLVGSVRYGDLHLKDLCILSVEISEEDGGELRLTDTFSSSVPYLKPIQEFRDLTTKFLESELADLTRRGFHPLLLRGIRGYINRLKTYDETKGLVRLAKAAVSHLDADTPNAASKARTILETMNHFAYPPQAFVAGVN